MWRHLVPFVVGFVMVGSAIGYGFTRSAPEVPSHSRTRVVQPGSRPAPGPAPVRTAPVSQATPPSHAVPSSSSAPSSAPAPTAVSFALAQASAIPIPVSGSLPAAPTATLAGIALAAMPARFTVTWHMVQALPAADQLLGLALLGQPGTLTHQVVVSTTGTSANGMARVAATVTVGGERYPLAATLTIQHGTVTEVTDVVSGG